ncbi:hypothetical protein [Ruminococcus flavefaciens]|uniref:hypothetical protein n=1 Tax=Ruminococcus flavefaciens TaxID=1265 RepID=UPI00048AB86C|nr:hypothetical protein [Ruminococcus flavefaciens]
MKYRFFAAFMGTLVIASALSACSNHNTSDYEKNNVSATEDTAPETVDTDAEDNTSPVISADIGAPSEECAANRPQMLFSMDSGDCVYSAFKDTSDGPEEVYFLGGKNGKAEELKLPEGSVVLYSDGKKLYYCSPADGICEYDNGKTTPLNKETKSENTVKRENFFFTDDSIYFAVSGDNGTEIKSMDYSGKLSDKVYYTERRNARIVGFYNNKLICSYDVGTNGYICTFESEKSSTELKTGSSPYIVGDKVYFIDFNSLCCMPLGGGEKESVSEERCTDFCFYEDKLIFTDGTDLFSAENGKTDLLLKASDIDGCDYISGVGITDNKLYVCGNSGPFRKVIAETDANGKVTEKITAGIDR